MKNPKKPARLPRKAPSNQTGGTAWGKKLAAEISRMVQSADMKKLILLNFPYIFAFYMVEKAAWLYRHCNGDSVVDRLMVLFMNFGLAYKSVLPSFHPFDLMVGLAGAAALKAVIYFKGKNAKKYRQGEEYGSARWGNQKDIEPFIDPVFENNVILTQTERLMMSGRPKHPKYARNKNVIVIGGSGSGKTRFYVKPNLMQMPEKVSYVVTDPKGTIIIECGKMLSDAGYKIKVLNTINFKKSMRYNPFHYIRSEKDILKLVNTIIANTKGDGEKSGEDFWVKAERLLYCALIGYIWYEAPEEEQNFSTLLEFINASETREDDETFKNAVDELFEELEKDKPEHFAVRQYKKYKLAAGGAETYTFDVGKMLEEHGHEVQYFGLENEKNIVGNRIGSYVTNMDFSQGIKANLNAPFRIIYSREARKKIRAVLDDFQPDVVHLNNIQYHLTPSIILEINKWRKETKKECKIVYTTHDYQLVCPSHGMFDVNMKPCERCLDGHYIHCLQTKCLKNSRAKSLLGTLDGYMWKYSKAYSYVDAYICCSFFLKSKLDTQKRFRDKTIGLHNFKKEMPHLDNIQKKVMY